MPRKAHPDGLYYRKLDAARKRILLAAIRRANGNLSAACRYLGIQPATLHKFCRDLGIDRAKLRREAKDMRKNVPRITFDESAADGASLTGWLGNLANNSGGGGE